MVSEVTAAEPTDQIVDGEEAARDDQTQSEDAVEEVSAPLTNASSTEMTHPMTISTSCTPSPSTHNTVVTVAGTAQDTHQSVKTESTAPEETQRSGGGTVTGRPMAKPFNRYNHHTNSQGDSRSSSNTTTITSPSNGGYQVHTQYVTQAQPRPEDQMQGKRGNGTEAAVYGRFAKCFYAFLAGYQPTGITYTATAIDANGNPFTGATNMPFTATYQQMV